ncbi:MAG: GGDEF domain-containing protein, partial [Panacagrimonas sp.]
ILYSIYFAYDSANARALAAPEVWGTMLVFAVPGNTALFIATFLREPWRYTLTVARVGALFHTSGMLLLSCMAALRGTELPFEFLIIQLLYDFFLLGLVWSEANVLAILTVSTAPLLMMLVERTGAQVFDFAFFVTSTAVLSSIGCHMQERAQRISWLRAQLLQSLSERDPLTSVYNHRSFYSRGDKLIRQARREGRNVAVLGVDIDYFKRFNDVYGHLAGDECLRQVSSIVADHARRPLDMAGRLGGEEFAIFLYDTNRANALSRAEDLREAVKSLNIPGKVRITISVGVATATPLDAVTMEAMVGQADVALYRAKHDQRDCVREWSDNKVRPSLQLISGSANSV